MSGIWTLIVGVEGKRDDHVTTTSAISEHFYFALTLNKTLWLDSNHRSLELETTKSTDCRAAPWRQNFNEQFLFFKNCLKNVFEFYAEVEREFFVIRIPTYIQFYSNFSEMCDLHNSYQETRNIVSRNQNIFWLLLFFNDPTSERKIMEFERITSNFTHCSIDGIRTIDPSGPWCNRCTNYTTNVLIICHDRKSQIFWN